MRRRGLVLATLLLASCDRFAPAGEQAVAAGPWRAVASAAQAARRCGVRDTRFDPLDRRVAVLMMGHAHSAESEHCLRAWLGVNAARFDPGLLARQPS